MSTSVKWWHLVLAGLLVALLCGGLWRLNAGEKTPRVGAGIPKGANADKALTIDMDGGH